ncbi:ankyrin repeat-containing protein BDA1-like [Cicer arietinum]|uniref:Ankyrin repeat-containing protein BDA1-like n=1 Tax=Cicer arietinum TaxID=3827 RepID=A0A1S2Z7B5_CICAR|nr:ankyrin repeat-containing protein BDA1-like [Cicer arietinum]
MKSNNVDQQLNDAAELGSIDRLYKVIQDDPFILERIDSIIFVETPLHIAASMGHIEFAAEIMRLKPSFGCKLNQQGFSPIHLAMQNYKKRMVACFINMNRELVRVQGREGLTPLHFASQIGDIDYLANFLSVCLESIEYLTVRDETALHIAIQNKQFEALQLLVGWLRTNKERGATELENKILNQMDVDGNTILHISAQISDPQTVRLLVNTGINLKAKNFENKTTLDMATNAEIKSILLSAGALRLTDELISTTNILDKMLIYILRLRRDISYKQRETWLIVATLVATATYQSAISPPGGIYQANAGDNNVNITSSNSTISNPGNVGKSVLSSHDFLVFSLMNTLSFLVSTIGILILTPGGRVGALVFCPVGWFVLSYIISLGRISPTQFNNIIVEIFSFSIVIVVSGIMITLYLRYQYIIMKWNRYKLYNWEKIGTKKSPSRDATQPIHPLLDS